MKIDTKAIKELAALLDDTGLNEIEVADGDQSIRVSRGATTIVSGGGAALSMPSDPTTPQAANLSAPSTTAQSHPGAMTSPMVGTTYLAPEPGKPPFAAKGTVVKAGDTLLIIEAMKVMNPIKAPRAGTITQILVEDGQPVEYGDVMMVIE